MFRVGRILIMTLFYWVFFLFSPVFANATENRPAISAKVRDFAEAMDLKNQVEASVKGYLNQFGDITNISPANARRLAEKLTWQNLEEDFLRIFQETFTEAELDQLVAFMRSPLGKKYIKSVPLIQEKSLKIVKQRFDRAVKDLNL